MGEHSLGLEIIQFKDPWNFLVKENPDTNKSPEACEFQKMIEAMNLYLNQIMEQGTAAHRPAVKEVCAVLKRETGQWYRVRVESLQPLSAGQQVNCYLIDNGSELTTSVQRFMKLPPKFKDVPPQIKKCCLWGVQPLTLRLVEGECGFDAKSTPSDKWDPSAIQYMSKTIGLSRGCQAEVVEKGLDGTLYVRLYFITKRGLVCFNEKLVEEKYAINVESTDTKNNFHYHHTIANSSGTHTSQHSGICRQDVSSAFEDMPPLVKDISSTSGDIYKSDLDSSHRSEQLEPSVEAFFSKAKEYLSSPESNLFSSPEKASESTSVQTARKEDISAAPSADNQKSFVHSKLAKLSLKQTFKHSDTNDGMKNFTQGRGRGLLKSMGITPAAESIQPGGLSPKRGPGLSSYDSHSPTFIEKTLSSHPALQIGQSHQNKSMSPQNTSFSISDPIFWGRGARPKGSSSAKINLCETFSKISQGKELSAGISGFQTDPGYSNEIHRAADMDLSEITKRFNIPAKTSDSDSRSSVDSGVRARYRRSVDSGKEKKERDKRAAEVEKSKDDYLRHLPGHNSPYSQWSSPPTQLLEALRTRSGQDSPRESEVPSLLVSHHQPTPSPMFGVVVHGVSIPPPKCELSEVPFHESVKQALNGKVETSRSIQAYVWPSVLNCSHIVGIAPPGKGKTMSYIPGLISHLLYPTTYIDLPEGKGPLALIIVPTWRKARDIFEMVGMFEETQKFRLRSIALYAGGTEDNETVQMDLIRGCKVLITTPLSLLRMLDQDFTSLKRVCHVVLDDAEVLASRFKKEVDSIMQLYKLVLQEHRLKNVPRQIMIFASHWDEGVNDFFMRYTRQPIVAISSRVEASVYGGVKQVVIMTKWEQRLVRFCGLLDTLTSTVQKVAAFTSHKTEAVEMWKAAQSRGVYCLLMHHEMPEDELRETRAQWQRSCHTKQLLVIVCTDQCYQDLAITNATSVIHYDLPSSKTKFGNRLVCMLDYFIDRTSDVKPEIEPVSHVILTNKDAVNAQSLYEILERCKADYSTQLCKFLEGYRMGLECDKRKNLCPFLKSFGECINQARCEHRHLLIPEQDLKTGEITHNTLPAEGQVKIQVIRVVNSTRYYCHLIEHQTHPSYPDNVKTELKLEYHRLSFEMVSFFSKEKNRTPYVPSDDPFEDGLCAFMDEDDIFHRAKVIELREGTTTSPMKKCRVWLVDAGYFKNGTVDQLVKLPRRLGEIPYQAVEVYLCCVKPMDNDSEWTDKADIFVHELVEGKQLVGRIMLRVGQTLWLFPLVHQVHIKKIGLATDFNIRQELLSNKFATPNPDHIQSLYKLCRGKTEIPEKIMRQYFDYCLEIEMTQETLSSRVEFHQVDMAAVISPKLFFVHKWENFEVLERLEEKIANTIERKEEEENEEEKSDSSIQLDCGSVCLALSEDEKWYRAKIMSESSDDQWEVFFLDYGDREKVRKDKIRPLPRHLAEVPCQAIECELAYIMPKGDEWPSEAVAIMCDLAYFVNEDKKQLYAKVVERIDPCYGMGQKLVIDLYDTNAADLRFAQELVWKHVAVGIDESVGLKPLLGKPALKNQIFFNPLDKIAFLVANLYWCEDHNEAVELANELHTLLAFRVKGWDIALEKREVLPSVVKVIGYIPDTESHGIVLDCLTSCCKESTRLCEIAVNENLISGLEHCLEQVSRPEIQYQAVKSVSQLVAQKGFCDYIANSENLLSILESFLKRHQSSTVDLKTLKCLCSASSHLVINNQASSDLRSQEMIDLIISVLTSAGSDIERESWLELLSSIATWESTHPYIMRESYLPVLLDLLKRCSCEKCLYYLMSICQTLVGGSRKHKKILLENEFLIVLTELLDNGLRSPVLELCQELVSAMALTYPQQEALAGVPVSHLDTTGQIIAPQVTWSQNCFRLLLTIKVRDAKFEDFHITSDKIQCRSNSDGKQYVLDWELYDKVLPDQSTVSPHSSHTIVSLRKDTKGQWDRLLKNKIRPANLSLDFDHPYDSDEEDVNDPENITKLQQKKNIFNQEGMWDVRRIRKYESEEEESSDGLAHYSSNENDEIVFDIESILRAQAQK